MNSSIFLTYWDLKIQRNFQGNTRNGVNYGTIQTFVCKI